MFLSNQHSLFKCADTAEGVYIYIYIYIYIASDQYYKNEVLLVIRVYIYIYIYIYTGCPPKNVYALKIIVNVRSHCLALSAVWIKLGVSLRTGSEKTIK